MPLYIFTAEERAAREGEPTPDDWVRARRYAAQARTQYVFTRGVARYEADCRARDVQSNYRALSHDEQARWEVLARNDPKARFVSPHRPQRKPSP